MSHAMGDTSIPTQELIGFISRALLTNPKVTAAFMIYVSKTKIYFLGVVGTLVNNPFEEPTEFVDPLVDVSACQRDLPFLQNLTVNVIRVYSVNSSLNHDGCMNLFSQAGIYTM
jgi:1,3-beta-glucanosyltransferase GAS1